MEKQERRQKKILTENRMMTINKRETSFEGLVSQLENGEDGIYNLIIKDKNVIFQPKVSITKQDLKDIPELAEWREGIKHWESLSKTAQGHNAYIIKRSLIEMRKDQYLIKNAYKRPIVFTSISKTTGYYLPLFWNEWIDPETKKIQYAGLSLLDPKVISAILCNYESLKATCEGHFSNDLWYLMRDFDHVMQKTLRKYPLYSCIVDCKIHGCSNLEIQKALQDEFGFTHSIEYISALWRNKIPKLIAETASKEWLLWYYTEKARGVWKKCNRCGQIKLAHSRFFSINKTSKDGWYSICKKCRNSKKQGVNANAKYITRASLLQNM